MIENGLNVFVGADKKKILDMYKNYDYSKNFSVDLYENGKASENILNKLLSYE